MLDLLLFPFKLLWGLLEGVFGLVSGLFSLVFGLIGGAIGLTAGIVGLVVKLSLFGLIIGVVVEFVRRHRARSQQPEQEEFISYYDKNAVQ